MLMDEKGSFLDIIGASAQEQINHTIEKNCFGLDLEQPIFRILSVDYLLGFLSRGVFSYSKPHKETWGDKYEAYLSGVKFSVECEDVIDGQIQRFSAPLMMKPALDYTYASCWTRVEAESNAAWSSFSRGVPSVRIQSTPKKLLAASINEQNKYFHLSHFVGEVEYLTDYQFKKYFDETPFQAYLDSLGRGLAQSFFTLTDRFSKEEEVRFLYVHHPHENPWASQNISVHGLFCTTPFEWSNVIDSLSIWPGGLSSVRIKELEAVLAGAGTLCEIS